MNQLNSLIVEGNLVRDAVLTEPAPGFKKCAFTLGVNRYYKNRNNQDVNEVSYFDVETYGKMAEYCEQKAKKGRGVRVVGRLKQDTWQGEDGKYQSKIYVVAEHVEYKPQKKTAATETPAEEKTPEPIAVAAVQTQEIEEEAVF